MFQKAETRVGYLASENLGLDLHKNICCLAKPNVDKRLQRIIGKDESITEYDDNFVLEYKHQMSRVLKLEHVYFGNFL